MQISFLSGSCHKGTIRIFQMLESLYLQGQRQLLTIARVFLSVPKILILMRQHPLSILTEVLIQDAFNQLMKDGLALSLHTACRPFKMLMILVMVDGDIVEHGTHEELMQAQGVYYKMQTAQQQISYEKHFQT